MFNKKARSQQAHFFTGKSHKNNIFSGWMVAEVLRQLQQTGRARSVIISTVVYECVRTGVQRSEAAGAQVIVMSANYNVVIALPCSFNETNNIFSRLLLIRIGRAILFVRIIHGRQVDGEVLQEGAVPTCGSDHKAGEVAENVGGSQIGSRGTRPAALHAIRSKGGD